MAKWLEGKRSAQEVVRGEEEAQKFVCQFGSYYYSPDGLL